MDKFNELINGEKPVLVDFFATWCGPCKMMHPILENVKKRLGDKVIILKIDVDVPANRQPVYLYHIQSVPTLMLFKQGKVLWNNSGVVQASQLQEIIEKYIHKYVIMLYNDIANAICICSSLFSSFS